MKMKKENAVNYLRSKDLSYFCMQISLLLDAGILLEEGIDLMRDEAKSSGETELLLFLSNGMAEHRGFADLLEEAGVFPEYMVHMAAIGEASGTLDRVMERLSDYYDREDMLAKDLRHALTYPAIMIIIMCLVMLVFATQVMPVFRGVFAQLSVQLAPFTDGVIRVAAIASGVGLVFMCACLIFAGLLALFGRRKDGFFSGVLKTIGSGGRLSALIGRRRLAQALSISLSSGLDIEEGFSMAAGLVENKEVDAQAEKCLAAMRSGEALEDAVQSTGLFTGVQGRLIRVGQRAGRLDEILERISIEYGAEADERIDNVLSALEPALVAVLSVITGGMLLLVMLPLLGVLSSLGS